MWLGGSSPAPAHPELLTPGLTAGIGSAIAHHGELMQGVFEDDAGQLRRALVTMPLPGRGSQAVFYPSQSHWGVVGPSGLTKARRAAIYTLREFAAHPSPAKGGRVELTANFRTVGPIIAWVNSTFGALMSEVATVALPAPCQPDFIPLVPPRPPRDGSGERTHVVVKGIEPMTGRLSAVRRPDATSQIR